MSNNHPNLIRKGRFWHYELKVFGHRIHGSTRATDLGTAKRVLEEKRRQLVQGGVHRSLTPPTFANLVKEWMQVNKRCLSPKHLIRTEQISRIWLLPQLGGKVITKVTTGDALIIRSLVLEAGRSEVTANNVLRTLKFLLNFGVRLQYMERIPCRISLLRVQKKPRPVLPSDRISEFLGVFDRETASVQKRCMVRVMLGLGMRESEVLGMRWEWFDPANQTYTVGKAKGKEARVLPVPDWVWGALMSLPKTITPWCFTGENLQPHRPSYLREVMERVCRRLGVGHITQHRLRATFATLHAEAGTPITDIQGMLGHKHIQTTMIYVEPSLDAKRRAQKNLAQALGLS